MMRPVFSNFFNGSETKFIILLTVASAECIVANLGLAIEFYKEEGWEVNVFFNTSPTILIFYRPCSILLSLFCCFSSSLNLVINLSSFTLSSSTNILNVKMKLQPFFIKSIADWWLYCYWFFMNFLLKSVKSRSASPTIWSSPFSKYYSWAFRRGLEVCWLKVRLALPKNIFWANIRGLDPSSICAIFYLPFHIEIR